MGELQFTHWLPCPLLIFSLKAQFTNIIHLSSQDSGHFGHFWQESVKNELERVGWCHTPPPPPPPPPPPTPPPSPAAQHQHFLMSGMQEFDTTFIQSPSPDLWRHTMGLNHHSTNSTGWVHLELELCHVLTTIYAMNLNHHGTELAMLYWLQTKCCVWNHLYSTGSSLLQSKLWIFKM